MNKKGFTLVELLVVITIIGLLVVIAVPASLTISKKVKEKMYDSKIELIEKEAILWGQEHKSEINKSCGDTAIKNEFDFNVSESDNITNCLSISVNKLIENNAIEPDVPAKDGDTNSSTKWGIVTNPSTNESMNSCDVLLYIKNNRVYAKFVVKCPNSSLSVSTRPGFTRKPTTTYGTCKACHKE